MKIKLLLILIVNTSVQLFCQIDLNEIKTPSSPAASVLGIMPNTILQPKTFETLEAGIFSNYLDNSGNFIIPNDFSIEFTPFWAAEPKMSIEEYLFPGAWESAVRTASFAIASTQNYIISDSVKTNAVSFGFRSTMNFVSDETKENVTNDLDTLISFLRIKNIVFNAALRILQKDSTINRNDFVDSFIADLRRQDKTLNLFGNIEDKESILVSLSVVLKTSLPDIQLLKEELKNISESESEDPIESENMDEFLNIIQDFFKISYYREKVEIFVEEKPGWKLDFAAALAIDFPSGRIGFSYVPQTSLWLTPSYTFSDIISAMGVFRYNYYNQDFYDAYFTAYEYFERNFDYGLGIKLSLDKLSFIFEAVGRSSRTIFENSTDASGVTTIRQKDKTDFQYVGSFSYHLSNDIVITYNIGKKFEPVLSYKGNLISVLSMNFGFGGGTSDNIKEE
jgi:hypothetical protein